MNNSTNINIDTSSSSNVPSYLGPLGALLACCIGGLTGFGDAITLHILWAIAGVIGLLSNNRRDVLAKAVTITAIMSLSNTPLALWVARKDLRRMFPYAVVTAFTGIPMVIVGIQLLFFADLTSLKIFVGLFFLSFSIGKLTSSILTIAREKLQIYLSNKTPTSPTPIIPSTSTIGDNNIELPTSNIMNTSNTIDSNTTTEINQSINNNNNNVTIVSSEPITTDLSSSNNTYGQQGWTPSTNTVSDTELKITSIPASSTASSSSIDNFFRHLQAYIEPASPKYSVKTTLLFCFIAGSGAGLLNGLLGTGGPPQMIAYAILDFNKDTIRAMSSLYGTLELPLRCYFMFAGEGNVFHKEDYIEYIGVSIASWAGFLIGTSLRKYVNTPSIIRILLFLVFASSGILLGALDNASIAITYIIGGILWLSILWLLWYRYYWLNIQNSIQQWDIVWLKFTSFFTGNKFHINK